ncbi:MAG: glycosyltransferase [Candidatus Bathyarchaeota archaeon]|nr:glycosyltransferase [Candidatus Bathyarchaeota archaeon]
MRVLAVTPSYPRFQGDYHGRFIHDHCVALRESGVQVTVLAPRSRSTRSFPTPFEVERFPSMPSKRLELLPERTMKGAPVPHLAQIPPYLASAYIRLLGEAADIIHVHWAIPLGYLATLTPRKTPIVVTCHGSDCTLAYSNPWLRPFVRKTFSRATRVVAVSDYILRVAVSLGARDVEVIYLGVDTERFRPLADKKGLRERMGLPVDRPIVGTLGRLVRDKRIGDFIEAAKLIAEETDAIFLIGGTGPEEARLKSLAKGRDEIVFLGEVHDPAGFHGLCDVSVLASVREGLSISLQEAMATACVPVASDGVGCRELVKDGENGYLFQPGDVHGLAQKIFQALEDPPLGMRARETIQDGFDIRENVSRYISLYEGLLR